MPKGGRAGGRKPTEILEEKLALKEAVIFVVKCDCTIMFI